MKRISSLSCENQLCHPPSCRRPRRSTLMLQFSPRLHSIFDRSSARPFYGFEEEAHFSETRFPCGKRPPTTGGMQLKLKGSAVFGSAKAHLEFAWLQTPAPELA